MDRRTFLASLSMMGYTPFAAATPDYPNRIVRLVNPFPSGPVDMAGRLIAKKFHEKFGQPFVLDNRPGGGGMLAAAHVSKSRPDGCTLLITSSSTHLYLPAIRKSLPYDAEKDFTPIWLPGQSTLMVVVNANLPFKTLNELLDFAKKNPDKLNFGSSGLGSSLHIAGEVFCATTDVKMVHVPYKSAASATTDLLAGQIQVMFDSPTNSAPNIRSGKVRALGILSKERWATLPDVATTAELGWPGLEMHSWLALFAPAGTPDSIVEKLTNTLREATSDPEVIKYFENNGTPFKPQFGAEAGQTMKRQRDFLGKAIRKASVPLIDS